MKIHIGKRETHFGKRIYRNKNINVKNLTEQLYGSQAPFGQAEVILSKRGSRLFCAFVSVNPEATATALNRTLCEMNYQQLLEINGDTRRHLIWGLENI